MFASRVRGASFEFGLATTMVSKPADAIGPLLHQSAHDLSPVRACLHEHGGLVRMLTPHAQLEAPPGTHTLPAVKYSRAFKNCAGPGIIDPVVSGPLSPTHRPSSSCSVGCVQTSTCMPRLHHTSPDLLLHRTGSLSCEFLQ